MSTPDAEATLRQALDAMLAANRGRPIRPASEAGAGSNLPSLRPLNRRGRKFRAKPH